MGLASAAVLFALAVLVLGFLCALLLDEDVEEPAPAPHPKREAKIKEHQAQDQNDERDDTLVPDLAGWPEEARTAFRVCARALHRHGPVRTLDWRNESKDEAPDADMVLVRGRAPEGDWSRATYVWIESPADLTCGPPAHVVWAAHPYRSVSDWSAPLHVLLCIAPGHQPPLAAMRWITRMTE
jgi:hypothetical protein